jgi:16S rRNA (uracil1498-N3)-methyltransferase
VHRFYVPNLSASRDIDLPKEEARHLARVLRLRVGDSVAVFDGRGSEALASVRSVAPGRVGVRIIEPLTPAPEPKVAITLAQALLKSDKMDRVIRDAVMLGVVAVQPFVSHRTDLPRAAIKSGGRGARWNRTVVASVKQSGRAVVPPVRPILEFDELLKSPAGGTRVMFVEPGAMTHASDLSALEAHRPSEAVVWIGPEGGWEEHEVESAVAAGVQIVTFGQRVLRADAAGALAIAVLRYIWRDL